MRQVTDGDLQFTKKFKATETIMKKHTKREIAMENIRLKNRIKRSFLTYSLGVAILLGFHYATSHAWWTVYVTIFWTLALCVRWVKIHYQIINNRKRGYVSRQADREAQIQSEINLIS